MWPDILPDSDHVHSSCTHWPAPECLQRTPPAPRRPLHGPCCPPLPQAQASLGTSSCAFEWVSLTLLPPELALLPSPPEPWNPCTHDCPLHPQPSSSLYLQMASPAWPYQLYSALTPMPATLHMAQPPTLRPSLPSRYLPHGPALLPTLHQGPAHGWAHGSHTSSTPQGHGPAPPLTCRWARSAQARGPRARLRSRLPVR